MNDSSSDHTKLKYVKKYDWRIIKNIASWFRTSDELTRQLIRNILKPKWLRCFEAWNVFFFFDHWSLKLLQMRMITAVLELKIYSYYFDCMNRRIWIHVSVVDMSSYLLSVWIIPASTQSQLKNSYRYTVKTYTITVSY